jgi:TrmH family RNA methyltransferase
MKEITSRDNALFKELKQLATSAQARKKANQTLLDGIHLAQAALAHGVAPHYCIVSESAQYHPEVSGILDLCEAAFVKCICLPDAMYQALSQVENGVAVLLLIETPHIEDQAALTESAVLLDQIQDPGNLGSILRSAAAAGFKKVFCSPGTAAAWSPKVLRAGMGAHFLLEIVENADLARVIEESQVPIFATSSYATKTIYTADLSQPTAWLLGHEGQGVSEVLQAMATDTVIIPQLGKVESLNVAAAAAICFFEQVRQQTS